MNNFEFELSTNRELVLSSLLVDEIENENIDEVMRLLLQMKADPNILLPSRGISPMHVLAGFENECFSIKVIELALKKGNGDPNIRSKDGLTPVHLAAMWGKCMVLEVLLNSGGNPYLKEFKFSMNAEDLALKEQQWQTHAIIATFTMFNDNEDDFEYLHQTLNNCNESLTSFGKPLHDDIDLISEISKENPIYVGSVSQANSQTKETQTTQNDLESFEEGINGLHIGCKNILKQDKIKRNIKLSHRFSESFSKLKDFFGRASLSKLSSGDSPKFSSNTKSNKKSL